MATMSTLERLTRYEIPNWTGLLAAAAAFIVVYAAAVSSVGWVIGIALGWIPAYLASCLAFFLVRVFLWFAVLGLLAVVFFLALHAH